MTGSRSESKLRVGLPATASANRIFCISITILRIKWPPVSHFESFDTTSIAKKPLPTLSPGTGDKRSARLHPVMSGSRSSGRLTKIFCWTRYGKTGFVGIAGFLQNVGNMIFHGPSVIESAWAPLPVSRLSQPGAVPDSFAVRSALLKVSPNFTGGVSWGKICSPATWRLMTSADLRDLNLVPRSYQLCGFGSFPGNPPRPWDVTMMIFMFGSRCPSRASMPSLFPECTDIHQDQI